MPGKTEKVQVREDNLTLPTYAIKGENRNPVFHSQYGVAHIYPYTLLDDIEDSPKDKTYHTLVLENKYLQVTVIPDLGGRVYSVFDKVSQREVFYKNSIVRFAPLAIRGAFFSGGVEFSFPVAHAPTTCDKVNWNIRENEDGSASISIGGQEHISNLRWMITLTLFPDRCALAQDVYLFNPGTIPGRYHYWTNASLDANDGTEFVYPLHRARSYEYAGTASWPYARIDLIVDNPGLPGMEGVPMWPAKRLQAPVNFRWQKNMLAQVSIFGRDVEWDYFGAWQHTVNHGYAHVAKSKDVAGMKLWSWGNAPVGVVNQTSLTDDGSVYAETQCGAMETQLDFAFLDPGSVRTWREWWLPLRNIGGLTAASEKIALRLALRQAGEDEYTLQTALCPAMELENAAVKLSLPGEILLEERINTSPAHPWQAELKIKGEVLGDRPISCTVTDQSGLLLLEYIQTREVDPIDVPRGDTTLELTATESYYKLGLKHENFDNREQAREAYQKSLELDGSNSDAHFRYGLMLLRSAQFAEADIHFAAAQELCKTESANYRGLIAFYLGDLARAEEYFTVAAKVDSIAAAGLTGLGNTAMSRSDFGRAVGYFEQASQLAEAPVLASLLQAIALRMANQSSEAVQLLETVLAVDPLNLPALRELNLANHPKASAARAALERLLADDPAYWMDLACFYLDAGLTGDAGDMLNQSLGKTPEAMKAYLASYIAVQQGNDSLSRTNLDLASSRPLDYCFPSRIWEVVALENALKQNPEDAHAKYYLGNFCYARERFDEAVKWWQDALKKLPDYDILLHNLGLASWQRAGNLEEAVEYFEKALASNPANQDLYLHLDNLYKQLGKTGHREDLLKRIQRMPHLREDVRKHSISMLTELGYFEEAIRLMEAEKYIPLEMDQSFHNTYVQALLLRAEDHLKAGKIEKAIQDYLKMLEYPDNLGVGAPTTRAQAHIYYDLGLAYEKLGWYTHALKAWQEAASEHHPFGTELHPYIQKSLDKLSRYSELGLEP